MTPPSGGEKTPLSARASATAGLLRRSHGRQIRASGFSSVAVIMAPLAPNPRFCDQGRKHR
jgi:hypothetical protein